MQITDALYTLLVWTGYDLGWRVYVQGVAQPFAQHNKARPTSTRW